MADKLDWFDRWRDSVLDCSAFCCICVASPAGGKVAGGWVAPLLFQVALLCDFNWFIESPKPKELTAKLVNSQVPRAISLVPLQNALKATLSGKERWHL